MNYLPTQIKSPLAPSFQRKGFFLELSNQQQRVDLLIIAARSSYFRHNHVKG